MLLDTVTSLTNCLKTPDLIYGLNQRLNHALEEFKTLSSYIDLIQDSKLSRSVVQAMRSSPSFDLLVKDFPQTSEFDELHVHKSSALAQAGLESLEVAASHPIERMINTCDEMVSHFDTMFSNLATSATYLKEKVAATIAKLEAMDIPNEAVAELEVTTLSDEGFSKLFAMTEKYLEDITVFDTQELRQNPDKLKETIDGLVDVVGDLGRALGITLNYSGITDCPRDAVYDPKVDTFSGHDITKTTLVSYLDRASVMCDTLISLAGKKDVLVKALQDDGCDIPTDTATVMSTEGESVENTQYGAYDHMHLFCCYCRLTTKLVSESLMLVTRVISTAETITALDDNLIDTVATASNDKVVLN